MGTTRGVSFPEHDGLEDGPNGGVIPVFTENISRIFRPWDMVELHPSCRDGFTCFVKGKCIVSLVEFTMGMRSCVDHCLIIPKHHGGTFDGHSKVSESIA